MLAPDKTPQPSVPVRIEKRGPCGHVGHDRADDDRRRRRVRRERRVDPRRPGARHGAAVGVAAGERRRGAGAERDRRRRGARRPGPRDAARDDAPARHRQDRRPAPLGRPLAARGDGQPQGAQRVRDPRAPAPHRAATGWSSAPARPARSPPRSRSPCASAPRAAGSPRADRSPARPRRLSRTILILCYGPRRDAGPVLPAVLPARHRRDPAARGRRGPARHVDRAARDGVLRARRRHGDVPGARARRRARLLGDARRARRRARDGGARRRCSRAAAEPAPTA